MHLQTHPPRLPLQFLESHCLFSTRWTSVLSCTGKYFFLGAMYTRPLGPEFTLHPPPSNKPSHSLKDMSHLTHPASPPHTQIPFTGPDPSAHTNHTRPQSRIQIPWRLRVRRRTIHLSSPRDIFHRVPQNTATCTLPALFASQVLQSLPIPAPEKQPSL